MPHNRNIRLFLPVLVIVPFVWLMIGCFYIPTFETPRLHGARRDFRTAVGRPGDAKPIIVGRVTRAQLEALLGPPQFASAGDRAIAYDITTFQGIWISPLCLSANAATRHDYAIKFVFDRNGLLVRWRTHVVTDSAGPFGFGQSLSGSRVNPQAIFDLNLMDEQLKSIDHHAEFGPEYLRPVGRFH